jgi:cytochrome c oxidase subunit 2
MFSEASNFVKGVDTSLAVILGISIFFLIAITVVMIYFVIRYSRKRNPVATNIEHNNALEILWTVIPTILVAVMFYYGWAGFTPMRKVPKDAMIVKAYGQMWAWSFEYENGSRSENLIVPLDKPVKLELISNDVLHSLYIPAYRIKEDVVPGKENYMWFIPQEEGSFDILCAEYCGERHSFMLSKLEVYSKEKYDEWYANELGFSRDHPGLALLKQNACISCHSTDGSAIIGPTFKGLWERTETVITNGVEREITVDRDFIRKSLNEPNADITKGFNPGLMISYEKTISDEDLDQIIEYLKTLK